MSYENAPATKMLATHCAICGRPLLDAKSVEIGIGPTCREKYGYSALKDMTEETRAEANKLIHTIALDQDGPAVIPSITRLMELGVVEVVKAIIDRVAVVKIAQAQDGTYAVKAPYSEQAIAAMKQIQGRRWDKDTKTNRFPAASKQALFVMLCEAYPNAMGCGPKGMFVLKSNPVGQKVPRTPMAA